MALKNLLKGTMGSVVDVDLKRNAMRPAGDVEQPGEISEVARNSAKLVVGVTHSQTCLLLRGRLQALREAGFRVTLLCSPGSLLEMMGESEGVETIAVPMERGIAPLSDLVSLFRLWAILRKVEPEVVEFSTPKAGLAGDGGGKAGGSAEASLPVARIET